MDNMTPQWRKSSHSSANGGECVEVALLPEAIGIRDSKNPDAGHLTATPEDFGTLLRRVKRGEPHR